MHDDGFLSCPLGWRGSYLLLVLSKSPCSEHKTRTYKTSRPTSDATQSARAGPRAYALRMRRAGHRGWANCCLCTSSGLRVRPQVRENRYAYLICQMKNCFFVPHRGSWWVMPIHNGPKRDESVTVIKGSMLSRSFYYGGNLSCAQNRKWGRVSQKWANCFAVLPCVCYIFHVHRFMNILRIIFHHTRDF